MTRPSWQRGPRNYDVDLLTFSTATPGFILGEAIIGTSLLGDRGISVEQDADFTSITVDEPTTVEDGLFVHREVAVCNLTATLPERVALRGQWIELAYDGHQLFEGRVSRAEWTESVDVGNDHMPGNQDSKTYRVQLAATTGEEKTATENAQLGPGIVDVSVSKRVQALTGYPVTVLPPAADLPLSIWNQDWQAGSVQRAALLYDTTVRVTLLEALRRECRAAGYVVLYQPRAAQQVVLLPVNRWLAGSTAADALMFTDEVIVSPVTDPDDEYLTTDRRVSYTARQVSEDASLFTNSVVLQYQVETTPGTWVDLTYGPYPSGVANPQDVVVDYGRVGLDSARSTRRYDLARSIVQTLPTKKAAAPYPSALAAPMQSVQQIDGTVPGMALMTADGVTERVAVLGRTHQITPSKWLVSYKFGPPHLLTRTSDFEPGPAVDVLSPVVVPGVSTTWRWTVPDLPADATWYEVLFKSTLPGASPDAVFWYTSTTTDFTPYQIKTADAPGTARTYTWTGPTTGDYLYVAYTTNVNANWTDLSSDVFREGQPAILGQQSH